MAYFVWADDMVIDNGPIDEDHRKLVEQVNTLHTATSEGRGNEIVEALLAQIIADTEEHLRHEEQQMEQAKFPDLERHKQGRALFVAQLRRLQRKHQGGSITVASELSTALRDWLSLHIRRNDKELRTFLEQKRRTTTTMVRALR
ncbi:bacteriohemerythrin [Giesbergeria giesbergeri]